LAPETHAVMGAHAQERKAQNALARQKKPKGRAAPAAAVEAGTRADVAVDIAPAPAEGTQTHAQVPAEPNGGDAGPALSL
jgi:hypothetical protein